MTQRRTVMTPEDMTRTLRRIAEEILESNRGAQNLVLVGIRAGGVGMARRICRLIEEAEGHPIPLGFVDIALHRDDFARGKDLPQLKGTNIPFSIEDTAVVLVDDVIFTGRSVRAALDALVDIGRPRRIELAVLIDRGNRELPIEPNFVGRRLETRRNEHVKVLFSPEAEPLSVDLLTEGGASSSEDQ